MKEIIISGTIGYDVMPNDIRAQLPDGKEKILVKVNTPGGKVFEGFEIYNMLKEHGKKAKVQMDITGLAGSVGSYLLLSGNEPPRVHKNSSAMFHRASNGIYANGPKLRQTADVLEAIDDIISDDLAKQTGRDKKEVLDALTNDYWLVGGKAIKASGIPVEYIDDDMPDAPASEAEARSKILAVCQKINLESGSTVMNQADLSAINNLIDKSHKEDTHMKQSFADFMKENPEAKADVLAFAEKEKPPAPVAPAAAVVATDPADGVRVSEILALAGVVLSAEIKAAIADPAITPEKFAYEAMKKNTAALAKPNAAALGSPAAAAQTPGAQSAALSDKTTAAPDAVIDEEELRKLAKKVNGGK